MVFPTFFNLSLNLAISSWTQVEFTVNSQSCFCWLYRGFSIFDCKEYNQSDFGIEHLVISLCKVFSCDIGRGCLLWLVHSLQRRQWHPTPVLLPGKSHGWRSLVGCSPWGREESDTTKWLHFHFSLSCIGEGNGNPLQCSFLENPRDGGAWWAAVYGVTQSRTGLKWLSSSSSSAFFWLNSISLSFASFCTPRPNLPVTPGVSWLPTFAFQSPMMKRTFLGVLVLEDLVGFHRTAQLQLLQHYLSGHRLGLLWYWMVALETNRDHSVIFEIASKYCILDSFVDYDGYSISSKGLLPTVVDIMVIWVKFTHSSPF